MKIEIIAEDYHLADALYEMSEKIKNEGVLDSVYESDTNSVTIKCDAYEARLKKTTINGKADDKFFADMRIIIKTADECGLPIIIKSVYDVERFFKYIVNERKINFHPDDTFYAEDGYLTENEALLFNHLMEYCFKVCAEKDVDIYEIGLKIILNHINTPVVKKYNIIINGHVVSESDDRKKATRQFYYRKSKAREGDIIWLCDMPNNSILKSYEVPVKSDMTPTDINSSEAAEERDLESKERSF